MTAPTVWPAEIEGEEAEDDDDEATGPPWGP